MAQNCAVTILAAITMFAPLQNDRFGHYGVMTANHPITEILSRWPSRRDVYEDAKAANPDLDMVAVHRWFKRGSLPSKYDAALIQGADRRGFGLHAMELVRARSGVSDQTGHTSRLRQVSPAQKNNAGKRAGVA